MLNLGDKVKDIITGYEGILVGRTEWLYGCSRVGIQSNLIVEGKVIDAQWFDEAGVSLVQASTICPPGAGAIVDTGTGGPPRPSGGRNQSR